MDLEGYKELLLLNYAAYGHMEQEIVAFLPFLESGKTVRLARDLEALGILPEPEESHFEIYSVPEAFGAAYVLEGSALGGMVIARHLARCEQLKDLQPQHFFNGEKNTLNSWKLFQQELALQDFDEAQTEELLVKARESFLFFERVFDGKQIPVE